MAYGEDLLAILKATEPENARFFGAFSQSDTFNIARAERVYSGEENSTRWFSSIENIAKMQPNSALTENIRNEVSFVNDYKAMRLAGSSAADSYYESAKKQNFKLLNYESPDSAMTRLQAERDARNNAGEAFGFLATVAAIGATAGAAAGVVTAAAAATTTAAASIGTRAISGDIAGALAGAAGEAGIERPDLPQIDFPTFDAMPGAQTAAPPVAPITPFNMQNDHIAVPSDTTKEVYSILDSMETINQVLIGAAIVGGALLIAKGKKII